jgi:hypothetical protein
MRPAAKLEGLGLPNFHVHSHYKGELRVQSTLVSAVDDSDFREALDELTALSEFNLSLGCDLEATSLNDFPDSLSDFAEVENCAAAGAIQVSAMVKRGQRPVDLLSALRAIDLVVSHSPESITLGQSVKMTAELSRPDTSEPHASSAPWSSSFSLEY